MITSAENVVLDPKLRWLLKNRSADDVTRYESYWKQQRSDLFDKKLFEHPQVYLEIGSGSGWMITSLAKKHPEVFFIGVERDRNRSASFIKRTAREGLKNVAALRGNAIPSIIHGIPDQSLDRLYVLYPCPFYKSAQGKNRWYLHPAMRHFIRALKPGGLIVWASDQQFYIDEAATVCAKVYGLEQLIHGALKPNAYNHLEEFPVGRTKFETHFLSTGQLCFELIVRKPQI